MKYAILLGLTFVLAINCKTIEVGTVGQLNSALKSVNPGDTIHLKDGQYHGTFTATRGGTSGSPITLTGGKNAKLSGNNYGFWLKASHWELKGFSVANSNKGIVLEGASHCILEDLDVGNVKQEGIHFRDSSSDNILRNSHIHNTGTGSPGFGEGVYIGQAFHNWAAGKQDKSDRNQVLNNKIGPNVAAEAVDIKEGSTGGTVRGNTFDGTGMKGQNFAESWIDVKGDSYTVEGNTGTHSWKNGFEIHRVAAAKMGGCNNKIINNNCKSLPAGGKCAVNMSYGCSNTVSGN